MAEIKRLGNLGGYSGGSFGGQVYSQDGLVPTINTCGGGDREPMTIECECLGGLGEKKSNNGTQYYQQDRVYSMGDISLAQQAQLPGGSYNYVEVKQATENGKIQCKLGGNCRLELPREQNKKRKSPRKRRDMSDSDNGESP